MFKKNIESLVRVQTSLNRNIEKGIILDRNERVDVFNDLTFKRIIKNISKYSLSATPDITELYKKIAKYHGLKKDNIYITQGITECISHIMFSTLKKDDEVILMHPTYPMYEVICKLHNVKYKLWKFNKKFELDMNDLKKLITRKTKLIFLVNPNLPIEYEFDETYKNKIYKICKKKKILVVYDEAYYHFGSKSEEKKITKYKNLIVMRTFSKAWGLSGIRLGYMISNKKLCNYISKCRSLVETNSLTFQVALWALKNKIFKDHVKKVKMGAKFIKNRLKFSGDIFHGGGRTNAIILKLPNVKSTDNLRNYLSKKNIYIRNKFNPPIEKYVRISLASPKKLSIFYREYLKWKKRLKKSYN